MQIISHGVQIAVTRKRVKNINMRAGGDGSIKMSIPLHCSLAKAQAFADAQGAWIQRASTRQAREQSKTYSDGELAYLWGEPRRLVVIEGTTKQKTARAIAEKDRINLIVPAGKTGNSPEEIELRRKALSKLRTQELRRVLPDISSWAEAVVGEQAVSWSVRTMSSRWGSCTPQSRRIRLSSELAAFPSTCLESVAIHECVHLLESSHNARFHRFMDSFYPNWKAARKILNAKEYL